MTLKSVPVVDLAEVSRLNPNELTLATPAVSKVAGEIKNACLNWGFFYIINHGVDQQLVTELRQVMKEFFDKPKEFKQTVNRHSKNFHGYSDMQLTKQKKDVKEIFDFVRDRNRNEKVSLEVDPGKSQWPEGMPHFRNVCENYVTKMHTLASFLMEMIFLALGTQNASKVVKQHFDENIASAYARLNFYPACEDTSGNQFGVGPHADSGGLTILLQDDDVRSLQVQKDGTWHEVPPIPGSFVINTGGMTQIWSNGLIKAPVHRVITNRDKDRYSVPFFFNPSQGSTLIPHMKRMSNRWSPALPRITHDDIDLVLGESFLNRGLQEIMRILEKKFRSNILRFNGLCNHRAKSDWAFNV